MKNSEARKCDGTHSENVEKGTTKQFAKERDVKDTSVRTRYCLTGSYFGTIPTKQKNGRLRWPLNEGV